MLQEDQHSGQQERKMLQEDQHSGQQERRPQWYQPPREPEIKQEPQQEGDAVEVKAEPPDQAAEAQFANWCQQVKPVRHVGLSLSDRIDLLVKTEAFITVQEGARAIGISEHEFLTITNNVLHMRRDDQIWMQFDPASEEAENEKNMDQFLPGFMHDKIGNAGVVDESTR